jgi:hypothetical protein
LRPELVLKIILLGLELQWLQPLCECLIDLFPLMLLIPDSHRLIKLSKLRVIHAILLYLTSNLKSSCHLSRLNPELVIKCALGIIPNCSHEIGCLARLLS